MFVLSCLKNGFINKLSYNGNNTREAWFPIEYGMYYSNTRAQKFFYLTGIKSHIQVSGKKWRSCNVLSSFWAKYCLV